MTSATLKKYLLGFLGGALFIWSLARIISFSVAHWGQPWPHPLLAIDGNSYIAGAERSITGAGLFPLQDIYHSPGYQYILGFLFWIGGSKEAGIAWSKSLNLALFAGSLILTFRLTRRFFDKGVAMLATLLFFCSLSWLYYCHMIQYEVVMGFLLLAWLSLESRSRCDSPKKEILVSFFSGALLFLLILIHSRLVFLAIVPLSRAWDHWRKKEMLLLRNVLLSLGAALVPIVAWSVYYSRQLGHLIWIMERRDLLFRLGNNPNALG
ncbi:MAG: hypothetical protein ACXVBE_18470, partial [Bdellovibrionota bacterium]